MVWLKLIVILSFNYGWGGVVATVVATEDSTTICETESCKLRSARILDYMDESVDPCDDFYLFTCGNFLKKSLGWIAWQDSAFLQALQNYKDKVRSILAQPIDPEDSKPTKDIKHIYDVCIKEGTDHRRSKAILDLLKDNGVLYMWPMNDDTWEDAIFDFVITETELRKIPYVGNSLLKLSVNQYHIPILEVDQPDLINKVYFQFDLNTENGISQYKKAVTWILSNYGIDQNIFESDLAAIVDFERQLENLITVKNEVERVYLYSVKDLKVFTTEINWAKLSKKLLSKHNYDALLPNIAVKCSVYLQELDPLLRNTPKKVIANYMFWHSIFKLHIIFKKHLAAFNSPHKIRYSHPDWEEFASCEEIATWSMPLAVNSLYMKAYLNFTTLDNAKSIATNIKNEIAYYNNFWMDDKSRNLIKVMSQNLALYVASAQPLQYDNIIEEHYSGLNLQGKYLFDLLIDVGKWMNKKSKTFVRTGKINDWRRVQPDSLWTSLLPSYFFGTNMLLIPEAILQPPFFDNDVPLYSNYATLGYLIGSDLVNGLHDRKMKYDADGKLLHIEDDIIRERAQCFIDQYNQFEDKQLQIKMNGTKSLGQNIADNGGLKMAYNAYSKQKNWEPSLPGLQQYDNYQMFMISAANMWCTNTISHTNSANIFRKSGDTTAQFRVNGPLMNMPDFHKLFNCPEGSNMNPIEKCSLW